jgi:hypothetical protein
LFGGEVNFFVAYNNTDEDDARQTIFSQTQYTDESVESRFPLCIISHPNCSQAFQRLYKAIQSMPYDYIIHSITALKNKWTEKYPSTDYETLVYFKK